MKEIPVKTLIREAFEARKTAWTPYSGFQVGAALLTKEGEIYRGCNIENAAYTPGNCAERTAIFKAVSEGKRAFRAIAVVGGPKAGGMGYAYPCGVCRQVMMEFCDADFTIIVAKSEEEYTVDTLGALLPKGFGPDSL